MIDIADAQQYATEPVAELNLTDRGSGLPRAVQHTATSVQCQTSLLPWLS